MKDFAKHDATNNPDWLWSICQSRVMLALHELHTHHAACLKNLEPSVAPLAARGVCAKADYKAGALVLVPITSSIVVKKLSDTVPPHAVLLQKIYKHVRTKEVFNVVLQPSGGLKMPSSTGADQSTGVGALRPVSFLMVALYWLVARGSAPNMVVKKIQAQYIDIPVLVNKTNIKKGEELVQRGSTATASTPGAPDAKRRKLNS